jgi:hypothetical protein
MIQHQERTGKPASVRQLLGPAGLSSPAAIGRHMSALMAAGRVEQRDGRYWALTEEERGRKPPALRSGHRYRITLRDGGRVYLDADEDGLPAGILDATELINRVQLIARVDEEDDRAISSDEVDYTWIEEQIAAAAATVPDDVARLRREYPQDKWKEPENDGVQGRGTERNDSDCGC